MAVPRTQLGGLLGGGTIVPKNNIDIGAGLDAIAHGATSLIQNAYLRRRQMALDAANAQQRQAMEQDRQDRLKQTIQNQTNIETDRQERTRQSEAVQREKSEAAAADLKEKLDQREARKALYLSKFPGATDADIISHEANQKAYDAKVFPAPPKLRQITDPETGAVTNVDEQGHPSPMLGADGQPFKLGRIPKADTAPTITANDAQGNPHFYEKNPTTHAMQEVPGASPVPKPNATGGVGGAMDKRMAQAAIDASQANARMKLFEQKLSANPAMLTPALQVQGQAAMSHPNTEAKGIMAMGGNAATSYLSGKAGADLAKTNPDFYQYLVDKKIFADGIMLTHPRPNQAQFEIQQGISGVDAGGALNPATIRAFQTRRDALVNTLAPPTAAPGAGGRVGGPSGSAGAPPPTAPATEVNPYLIHVPPTKPPVIPPPQDEPQF